MIYKIVLPEHKKRQKIRATIIPIMAQHVNNDQVRQYNLKFKSGLIFKDLKIKTGLKFPLPRGRRLGQGKRNMSMDAYPGAEKACFLPEPPIVQTPE